MIDLLGRAIKAPISKISQMMLKNASTPVFVRTATGEKELATQQKILEAVIKLDKNTVRELQEINTTVRAIANSFRNISRRTGTVAPGKADTLERTLTKALGGRAGGGGSGGGGGGGGLAAAISGSNSGARRLLGVFDKINIGMTGLQFGLGALSKGLGKFTQALGVDVGKAFQGIISDEMTFITNMRKISSEVIQSGQDYVELSKSMVEIGKVVNETNVSRVKYQELYQDTMRKGLTLEVKAGTLQRRTIKDQQRLLKNSLATASLIGSDVDQTAHMFDEWNRQLGLSNSELAQVGNSMRDIARLSGVSGNNLLSAAQEATSYIKTLQRTGALDAISAGNVIQSTAIFKKYGVEEVGGNILKALSSKKGFMESEPQLQALLSAVANQTGQATNLLAGNTLRTKAGKRTMLGGIENFVNARLQAQFGISDVTKLPEVLKNLDRMGTADANLKAMNIRNFTENALGIEAGDLARFVKATKEDLIPLTTKISDLEAERAKTTNADQRKGIESKINDLRQQEMMDKYSVFQDNFADTNNMAEALKRTNQYLKTEGMGEIAGAGGVRNLSQGMLTALRRQAEEGGLDFDKIMTGRGFSEAGLVAGMSDEKLIEKTAPMFQELQNEVLTALQAEKDPMMKTNRILESWNDGFKNISQSWLFKMDATTLMGVIAGGIALQGLGLGFQGVSALRSLRGLLGGGGGAGGVAAGAGGAARGAGLGSRIAGAGRAGGRLLSKAALPIAALVGGVSRQFDTGAMAKAYGTSWENMSIGQRGGARGANFITGAISGMSTDLVDTVKNVGVFLSELMGFKPPQWLKDFSLTETLGLGPDGAVTKAVSYVTGYYGWIGEKIGASIGGMYSYVRDYVFGEAAKLDAEIAQRQQSHKEQGFDKAFTDPNNAKYKHWQNEMVRDATVENMYGKLGGQTGAAYSEAASGILKEVLKSSENVGGAAGSDWSRALSEIDRSKLSGSSASLFDQLSGRSRIADLRAGITNDLMGSGMSVGPQLEAERERLLTDKLKELGLNPDGSKVASEAFKKMTEPGSIYTHDIHVEELLRNMMSGNASATTAGLGAFRPDQGAEATRSAMEEKGILSSSGVLNYTDSLAELMNVVADNISLTPAKAVVSTNLFTPEDAEDYVARQVETAKPSGPLAILPSVDSISDYLTKNQSEKLDRIISELNEIKQNTKPVFGGIESKGQHHVSSKPVVPTVARELLRGYWRGVQVPAYAEQSNTTGDLNGGSA